MISHGEAVAVPVERLDPVELLVRSYERAAGMPSGGEWKLDEAGGYSGNFYR
ncbi:MAG: hypothetical protein ACYDGY_03950 [Acidimicrobiales bacterium]